MNKIEKWIADFKAGAEIALDKKFTNGYCYHFAKMLQEVFGGTILYNEVKNHFMLGFAEDIDKQIAYDVTGMINLSDRDYGNTSSWNSFKQVFESEATRIRRDCILKRRGNVR